ncbi:hypothetical protein KMZ32_05970 [Phycicoccus sp. MAQZ13P-2]|uniref:hypothetical protein n=1 Tax=Phycicoccus mangrovi TaxID=2840470 RepID=UPI001C005777|nr:hypothetical protein [Phycicoccus mangrovi]MBT9273620.1 hypothetical protein [Phycicoccus mangrovi]
MELDLELDCDRCGRRIEATTRDLAAQRIVRCPNGHATELVDEARGGRDMQAAMDDLERALDRFGKR